MALNLSSAIEDFQKAHRKADLEQILSFLTGKTNYLLSFNEILGKLHEKSRQDLGLQEIPLDAVIGSVGRYQDFNRSFLPRSANIEERWANVKVAMSSLRGVPPIDVYKIGEVYFVLDGNHRASVARDMGHKTISAYVTEIKTLVPLAADFTPDKIVLMEEKADFLEATRLETLLPQVSLDLTAPGMYQKLLDHIRTHRYFMGIEQEREISFDEAVVHWYEDVYIPLKTLIQRIGILRDFPGRTETDMYLWIMEYHAKLEKELGWQIEPVDAAASLAERFSTRTRWKLSDIWNRFLDLVTFGLFEAGPAPGEWRSRYESRQKPSGTDRLFKQILVPVREEQDNWQSLDQAVIIARKEHSRIFGLHVVASKSECCDEDAERLKEQFKQRCVENGINGSLAVETGSVTSLILERLRWTDLVTIRLNFPPDTQPISRLRSGIHTIIQRSSRPLLIVPNRETPMENGLLAFDGSSKAKEALYLAAYFALLWGIKLSVVSVLSQQTSGKTQVFAREYLQGRNIKAKYLIEEGPNAAGILRAAEKMNSDFIIMGSYGFTPVKEVVMGSTVDQLLLDTTIPVLICR